MRRIARGSVRRAEFLLHRRRGRGALLSWLFEAPRDPSDARAAKATADSSAATSSPIADSSAANNASTASADTSSSASASAAAADAAPAEGSSAAITYRKLLLSPNVQALSALSMSTSFSQGCFMAVLTLHARELFDATAADIGLMFSMVGLSYVAGGPMGGWLASRTGRKALIVPGVALSNVAFGSLAFADGKEAFYLLLLLSNLAQACVSPAISAFTAEALPPEARVQAMSISRMSADVASLGAPLALGILADVTTSGTAILATAGLCGGCTSLFALRADEGAVAAVAARLRSGTGVRSGGGFHCRLRYTF